MTYLRWLWRYRRARSRLYWALIDVRRVPSPGNRQRLELAARCYQRTEMMRP